MTMSKAEEKKKGGGDRVQIDMHNVSLTASPVRKNKHTTPGTQKLENSKVHKSEIFLWGVFVFVISYNNPSQENWASRSLQEYWRLEATHLSNICLPILAGEVGGHK